MEETNTYRAVRIEDASCWRLVIYISSRGISAYVRNEESGGEPVITLFRRNWEPEEDGLLSRIETAVYDNPQLFDEFSTDIVICTEKAVWAPSEAFEEQDEDEIFNEVYQASEEDIFTDELEDKRCLYGLVAGLQAFIRRTLPGARTWCHQTPMVRNSAKSVAQTGDFIHVNLRKGEADFIGFRNGELVIAVTHPLRFDSEAAYHVVNIADIFSLGKEAEVILSGGGGSRDSIRETLQQCGMKVRPAMVPALECDGELPLSAALLFDRHN